MSTLKVNKIESFTDSSPVHLNDQVGISGSMNVSGSIKPHFHSQHDLGDSFNKWRDLYVGGIAFVESASIVSGSFTSLTAGTGEVKITSPIVKFTNLPTSNPGVSGMLFTQSGSQLFSSSAFPGGSNPVFKQASLSSSIFVIVSS